MVSKIFLVLFKFKY